MSARELLKRALRLEDHFGSGDDDEELGLDWEGLSQEEKDILIAGARVELKHRIRPGEYDFSNITVEDKATRTLAYTILEKHLEKKSVIN